MEIRITIKNLVRYSVSLLIFTFPLPAMRSIALPDMIGAYNCITTATAEAIREKTINGI